MSASPSAPPSRKVLVAGATGLVGRLLIKGLLADETVSDVYAPVRRTLEISHPKLHVQPVDFGALPVFPPVDEAYLALGTTIRIAGSLEAFRAVDFDANLAVARAAVQAGARRIGLVSAAGANARSAVFYNRVKGELEDAMRQLRLDGLVIARPSLLLDGRAHLGQPPRMAESLTIPFARLIAPLIPATYRPIHAAAVDRALLQAVPTAQGVQVLSSGEMAAS